MTDPLAQLAHQAAARVGADVVAGVLRALAGVPEPAPSRRVDIYALCDPDTGEIRYVGRSVDAEDCFAQHLNVRPRALRPSDKEQWILDLQRDGKKPTMRILEVVPMEQQREAEARWIEWAERAGNRLTNTAIP